MRPSVGSVTHLKLTGVLMMTDDLCGAIVMERSFRVGKTQCEGCEVTIEKHLLAVQGVLDAKVDANTGKVRVRYDLTRVRFDELPAAVREAGFPRVFEFSDEHHQDFLWSQKEEAALNEARRDCE